MEDTSSVLTGPNRSREHKACTRQSQDTEHTSLQDKRHRARRQLSRRSPASTLCTSSETTGRRAGSRCLRGAGQRNITQEKQKQKMCRKREKRSVPAGHSVQNVFAIEEGLYVPTGQFLQTVPDANPALRSD